MPSSISSSSALDAGGWRSTVGLALVLLVIGIGGFEAFWRSRGFQPALRDDDALWCLERLRLPVDDPDAIAVIGSSRIHLAIQPAAFSTSGLEAPLQLAIAMAPTPPMLEHLATDSEFRGVVLAEVNPRRCFQKQRWLDVRVATKLRAWREFDRADVFEQRLRMAVQRAAVFRLPDLSPASLRRAFATRKLPTPSHITIEADRTRYADFDRFAGLERKMRRIRELRETSTIAFLDETGLTRWLARVEESVARLHARGGDVFFVRTPTAGFIREHEAKSLPRAFYWDALAAHTVAATIHFEDHPSLRHFVPIDNHHLDRQQAAAFSRALGEIVANRLRERGRT